MLRDLSIRYKLTLLLVAVVGVALLVSSGAIVISNVRDTRADMKNEYSTLAKVLAANSAAALSIADVDPTAAQAVIADLEVEPSIVFAALYDAQGNEVGRYESTRATAPVAPPSTGLVSRFTENGFLDVVEAVKLKRDETTIGKIYLRASTEELNAQIRRNMSIVVAVFLSALALAAGMSFVLQRIVSVPILDLARATGRISSEHDYSIRVEKLGNDELGVLCDGFNAMLREIQQKDSDLAASNSSLEQTVREMASTLNQLQQREVQLEQANVQRENTIQGIRSAVKQLSAMSEELMATITEQASGARQQAAAVSQTSGTVDEVATSSAHAEETARRVGDTARRTVEAGEAGRQGIEDCIAAMKEVNEQVQITADNTLSLAQHAQAIGEIIETVKTIAEEINILSLNAAIEASRAGEHGRGFAVVAADVKRLADQSQKGAHDIRLILGEIREATNKTVLSTEQGNKAVKKATGVVVQAGSTIETLSRALGDSSHLAAKIAASARQQVDGMKHVTVAMSNIERATQQSISATRQVEQTSQSLTDLSTQLTRLIEDHEVKAVTS